MADTGYPRTMASVPVDRSRRVEDHATDVDWQILRAYTVTPPTSQPWHAAAYVTADVDAGVTGQLRIRSSRATTAGTPPVGTGSWTVANGVIVDPAGKVFRSTGLNGGAPLALGTFGDPTGYWRWYGEGFPDFTNIVDVWPGTANGTPEQYPGGLINAGRYFSSTVGNWVTLEDKVWAMTGFVSPAAVSFGIPSPRPDHWHMGVYRMNCHVAYHPEVWQDASVSTVGAATTIPQFVARVQELVALGLVVAPEYHSWTGANPVLPAALVANPMLASTSLPAGQVRDMLEFYDAMCAAFPGGGFPVWMAMPNEAYTTGPEDPAYRDFVTTLARRFRGKGFAGIITAPLGHWCGDLAGLARGDYTNLINDLAAWGVGWSVAWELHNYGKNYTNAGTLTNVPYDDSEMASQLTACRAAGNAVWMAEYGQAIPIGTGAAGLDDRVGVALVRDVIATDFPEVCPTWWTAADNTFVVPSGYFSLTLGPGQTETVGSTRRYPWWDIDGSNLQWLSAGGRVHWDAAHTIAASVQPDDSTATGISPAVPVTKFVRNLRLGFEAIPGATQTLFVEGRRITGSGGVRLIDAACSVVSAPPIAWQTSNSTTTGGGGGGGGGTTTPSDARSTFVAADEGSSFLILPNWFSPPAQPGDKVVLIGAAAGPSDVPTLTWNFPGQQLTINGAGTFHPRAVATLVDYNAAGWTVAASGNFRPAAIALRDTVGVAASVPVIGFSPVDTPGIAHDANAMGFAVTILNFTTAAVTAPPAGHQTIVASPLAPRQIHISKLAQLTAGTYDPGPPTTGPGSEESVTFSIVAQPTALASAVAPPTTPAFNAGAAITLPLAGNIASLVAAQPAGTHFRLLAGTYTNWNDVRAKTGMHFRAPAAGVAVLEGNNSFIWAIRAIDATGSSDNVTMSGPTVGSIKIQNYGGGTARGEYGAVQAQPTNTGPGSNEYTYGVAQNWHIEGVEFVWNSAGGLRISDYCTVYNCLAYGHTVSGLSADRAVGGLIHSSTFEANGLNPSTGAASNGANVKLTSHNGSDFRTKVLPTNVQRAKAPLRIVSCVFRATRAGTPGVCNIGLWLDLDCQQVEIINCTSNNHPWTGLIIEGCNNIYVTGLAVDNSDGYGAANGEDFILGGVTIAESTNVLMENYGIVNSVRAIIIRQSNRSGDWFNANNASFVNYAWAAGPRYWLEASGPTPVPGINDRSNMWSGNITVRNGLIQNCERVILSEGSAGGGMAVAGSIPLNTIVFTGNDYSGSPTLVAGGFFDRSNSGVSRTVWQAKPYQRDQ